MVRTASRILCCCLEISSGDGLLWPFCSVVDILLTEGERVEERVGEGGMGREGEGGRERIREGGRERKKEGKRDSGRNKGGVSTWHVQCMYRYCIYISALHMHGVVQLHE